MSIYYSFKKLTFGQTAVTMETAKFKKKGFEI